MRPSKSSASIARTARRPSSRPDATGLARRQRGACFRWRRGPRPALATQPVAFGEQGLHVSRIENLRGGYAEAVGDRGQSELGAVALRHGVDPVDVADTL